MTAARCALVSMVLLALAEHADAATVTLTAARDNTLFQESGALSNGAGAGVFVGRTTGGMSRRAVLRFDLSTLPPGTVINSATLSVHVGRSNSGGVLTRIHRAQADWGEAASDAGAIGGMGAAALTGDATWTHRFYSTQTWTNPGGDYAATESSSQTLFDIASYSFPSTPLVVSDVQNWVDNPAQNFGWLMIGDEIAPPPSAKRIDSREAASAAVRPQLLIDYVGQQQFVPPLPVPTLAPWARMLLCALFIGFFAWRAGSKSKRNV